MMGRLRLVVALFTVMLTATTPARADEATRTRAFALFAEGRRLVSVGKFAEACDKFAESEHLLSSAGTLVNLADCYERVDRTASAWSTWKVARRECEVLRRADCVGEADRRLRSLEGRLVRLVVTSAEPDVVVVRDGMKLLPAELGVPVPVDPGRHELSASKSGRTPWAKQIEVSAEAREVRIEVPVLDPAGSVAPPPLLAAVPAGPPQLPAASRVHGAPFWIASGVAAAGLVVGGALFAIGGVQRDQLGDECRSAAGCSEDDKSALETRLLLGDVALGVGLVSAAVAIVLYVTAPRRAGARSATLSF